MAKRVSEYGVLRLSGNVDLVADGIGSKQAAEKWIKENGKHTDTYRALRFCGPVVTVTVQSIEKRLVTPVTSADSAE